MSEQLPIAPTDTPGAHPVRLVVTDDLQRSRLTVFFRILLVIPHLIWLAIWGIAVWFAVLAAWVVGIFAGRVPDGLHGFIASYLRYLTHVYAYYAIAADPFPSFSGAAGYPVDVEIAPPTSQSRLTVFFRLLLAIPAYIVLYVLGLVAVGRDDSRVALRAVRRQAERRHPGRSRLLAPLQRSDVRLRGPPDAAVSELLRRLSRRRCRASRSSITTPAASRSGSSRVG